VCFNEFATKPQEQYTSDKYKCFQAWKLQPNEVPQIKRHHYNTFKAYMEETLRIEWSAVQRLNLPAADAQQQQSEDEAGAEAEGDNEGKEDYNNEPTVAPTRKKKKVNWVKQKCKVGGVVQWIDLPSTHRIIQTNHYSRWETNSKILKNVREKLQSSQYDTSYIFTQALWAIGMASVPHLAMSAAQFLFPIIIYAFLRDTRLFDYNDFALPHLATSFPSDWWFRKFNLYQAARDVMSLGFQLTNQKIFMACDKGNKQGVSHFVKVLSWWERSGKVGVGFLDIDGSGGTSSDCADAIRVSMNKLKANDNDATHLLSGQCTDSGGGGVLDSLADELRLLNNVIHDGSQYLIANCCIHSLQNQLSNGVKEALGDGGLGNINAMQLIHTV